jgi:hypothetical protein
MKTESSNLNCERHDELLDYLYEEMSGQQAAAYVRHLDECATCTTELQSLRRLRTDLRAWDVVSAPALEIVIPRSPWQALKECFTLFPLWGRGALALSAAAATLLMAFGAFSLMRGITTQPNAPAIATATIPAPQVVTYSPELQAQIEKQVSVAVTKAVEQALEQERQALRTQLATFETRNAEQQTRVQTVARQLRELQTRHDALLAEQQPSLRRLMADYGDAGNER